MIDKVAQLSLHRVGCATLSESNGVAKSLLASVEDIKLGWFSLLFAMPVKRRTTTVFVVIKAPEKNNSNPVWCLNYNRKNCARLRLAPKLGWRLLNMLHLVRYRFFFNFASCMVISLDVVVEEVPYIHTKQ